MSFERVSEFVRENGGEVFGNEFDFSGSFYFDGAYVWLQSTREGKSFDTYIGAFNVARYVYRVSGYDKYGMRRCLEEHRNMESKTIPLSLEWYQEETLVSCVDRDEYFSDICISCNMYRFDEHNYEVALTMTLSFSDMCMDHMDYTPNHSYVTN